METILAIHFHLWTGFWEIASGWPEPARLFAVLSVLATVLAFYTLITYCALRMISLFFKEMRKFL